MLIFCPVDTVATVRLNEEYNAKHPDNPIPHNMMYNYIGAFQAKYTTEKYPSVSELEDFIKELNSDEVQTAIPIYNDGNVQALPQSEDIYVKVADKVTSTPASVSEDIDIEYTPKGKERQKYTVSPDGTIKNSKGRVVFAKDSVDRNKILTNVAFKRGEAVKIDYKDKEYVVYKDGKIVSVTTGRTMQWGEENGDRKAIINIANSKFPSTNTPITPAFSGQMYYDYGNQRAEGVTATNTIDAIKRGERTATTRYTYQRNIDYWKKAKVGDVIRFHNNKEGKEKKEVFVRVTKALHKLPKTTTAEEWSKKEGWDTSRFEQKAKPQIEQGNAYQMEFEYIGDDTTSKALNPNDNAENFNNAAQSAKILSSPKTILSNEELKYWNEQGVDNMPKILTASERTDPAFHVKEILDIINGKKKVPQWGIVNGARAKVGELTGKDFAGLYLITKHDGLPMKQILETKIPKIIHFSITSLGGTIYEPGVMKYNDLLDRISEYIAMGLDPNSVTIRIDPIVPGVTKAEDIENIIKRASEMGIRKIKFSIMDAYSNTVEALKKTGYDFEKYYGSKNGVTSFTAKKEYLDEIVNLMLKLKDKYQVTLGTCAENIARAGINKEGCLSVGMVNEMLGTSIEDKGTDNNNQRKLCSCYGGKIDGLAYNNTCASHCVYCYAKHENDKALEYYNEDGSLKDNIYTRTTNTSNTSNNPTIDYSKVKIVTTDKKKGKISLYELVGNTNEEKLNFFRGWLDYMYNNNESMKSQLDEVFTKSKTIKNIDALKRLVSTPKEAYSLMLYSAQSSILNSQLNTNTNNIANAIKKLIKLKNLKKNQPQQMKQEQEKQNQQPPKMGYQTHIKVRETLTSQMRRDISPIHRRYRVENIARHFIRISKELVKEQEEYLIDRINRVNSSDLSDYKKNKIIQDLQQSLNEIRDKDTGPTVAVQTEGVNKVFDRVRSIYENYINTPIEELIEREKKNKYAVVIKRQEGNFEENLRKHVEYTIAEYKKVLKYFTPLMNEAYPEIESMSGISLSDTIAEDSQNEVDENGNPITDTDNEVGQAFKDGWMTRARYINPISTLSKRIKAVLSELPELGPKGNLLADDIGNARTMDSGKVYVILLTESHKLFDIEQFSTKDNPVLFFERLTAKYPWGKQIIKKLKNEDGSYNIPLISEFYTCLRMQFVPYFVSRDAFITAANIESGFQGTFDKTMTNIKRGYRLNKSMSIYTSDGKINRDVIGDLINLWKNIDDNIISFDELTEDEVKELAKDLSKLTKAIGFEFEEKDALALLNDEERRINFLNGAFGDIDTIINGAYEHTEAILFADDYKNAYADVTYGLNIIGQEDLKTSFFNSGKQKYSYSYPNYTHKIITRLSQRAYETASTKTGYSNMFNQTIEEEFKKDTIFFREGRFFNKWLDILSDSKEARSKFVHIQMDSIDGKDYTDWTTADVYTMLNNAFENSNESSEQTTYKYAYYHMPILADSPAMMMIRAPKFTKDGYEKDIIKALTDVVLSEMHRINRVKKRAELIRQGKLSPITNYDMILDKETGKVKKIGGAEFKFFPELNNYQMEDGKFTDLVKEALDKGNKKKVNKLITEALTDIMERGYAEFKEEAGDYFDNPREFYYNSVLATTQIIQLTTSDLAFYKDVIDFQKRFKEVYAAGKRFNTNSELGKQNRRVAYLRDQYLPSKSLADIRNSLAKNSNLDNMAIDYIMTKFKRINVTDAQAYLSPKAYEIMIDMLGQLTPKAKAAFERFRESAEIVKNGGKPTWTAEDFSEIWQTFKPFMYTQIYHESGIEGDESLIKTPLQHKNSEIMISTLFNLVAGPYSKSDKLNAMVKFMEKHDIDAFMFESAVKVGGHDFTDLNYSPSRLKRILKDGYARIGNNTIKSTKEVDGKIVDKSFEDFMEDASDLLLKGKITKTDYQKFLDSFEPSEAEVTKMLEDSLLNRNGELDESRIDTVPYEDVMIAQENPEHLVDQKKATFGSQFANIIFSDFSPNNPIKLSDGTVLKSSEAKDLYHRLRVENIIKGYRETKEIVSDIDNLEEYLTNTINSNPSYSNDLLNAVKVVDYKNSKGEDVRGFNFPPHTPAMAKKLNQLIFSLFKNKVTKQFINGGNAVLVSDFGLTDSLEIEYDDKGNLVGIQCYLPAYSKEFFKPLMGENGHLDIEKLHKAGLDKVIGYRIPTEGKYSMAPLIIKGFLPQQNGSVIMLPSDITSIAGSDKVNV